MIKDENWNWIKIISYQKKTEPIESIEISQLLETTNWKFFFFFLFACCVITSSPSYSVIQPSHSFTLTFTWCEITPCFLMLHMHIIFPSAHTFCAIVKCLNWMHQSIQCKWMWMWMLYYEGKGSNDATLFVNKKWVLPSCSPVRDPEGALSGCDMITTKSPFHSSFDTFSIPQFPTLRIDIWSVHFIPSYFVPHVVHFHFISG